MNFLHWDTQPTFTLSEAACLIAGIDPLTQRPRSDEADARRALVYRQLEEGYLLTAEESIKEISRLTQRGEKAPEGFLAHTGGFRRLRSLDYKLSLSGMEDEEPPYTWATAEYLQSLLYPHQTKCFEREEIASWCVRRGWDSKYDFSATPAWTKPRKKSSVDSTAHPRSERNYLALIVAMAIDKYGYEPMAKKSGVASDLAILVRANGFNLTDEAIRGYLREGSAYLKPQKTR